MNARRPFWAARLAPACATLLFLNLVLLAVWTLPQGYKQRNAAARLDQARLDRGREREALAALRERAAAIRANSVDRERFYRERVGGYDSGELFTTIEAVEAMVRAPGLRPGARRITREAVPRTSLERLQFTLPLEGSYPQLVGFLRNVENSTRFIAVDGIGMRAAEQRGAALQVQLSAYLKTPSAAVEKRGARAR